MANPEHLEVLRKGISEWNKWRSETRIPEPDLQDANLELAELTQANFKEVNLRGANLSEPYLGTANLRGANLSQADLGRANLSEADLGGADLSGANFGGGFFNNTHLGGIHFIVRGTEDFITRFAKRSVLNDANFLGAVFHATVFADLDMSKTIGLESARHSGPSTIGIDTLFRSHGKIPDEFLRGAGVSEDVILHLMPLIRAGDPVQWHSCFISYSTKDEAFAVRLHSRMRQANLRVWFAPEDMKGGDYFFEQIERAIQLHDRLLLVLSEESIQSKWVEREIRRARKTERAEKRRKLFPICLCDWQTIREWECLDHDTGEDLAEEVRKYHILDFSNWKNHDAFETAFTKLHVDLKASTNPPR